MASKRRASVVALVLAAIGSAAQVAGWNLGEENSLGYTIVVFAGLLVGALAVVIACAALVGSGPRAVALVAIALAVAPVVVLVAQSAFTPMMPD